MKISEHFGGAFLSGEDVPAGKSYRLQCGEVHVEHFEDGTTKPVLGFQNAKKQLVLNKTNASSLAAAWGDDTESWYGGWLELFSVPTNFNGRIYNGLRVRPLEPPAVPPQTTNPQPPAPAAAAAADFEAARQQALHLTGPENIPF